MTERNEQGFVRDINQAIEEIKQYNQSSKEKVRALISLPFDFNDVPPINNFINGETTQPVECIDELNNIAILNEQILEFDETLKSKFEERHDELVEALMNRLEGVFKMYNNENLDQNVQQPYPVVGQPIDVQTPQVEEFSPVTPVESYAVPAVEQVPTYGVTPEAFAEPTLQEPVAVPQMGMPTVDVPTMETPVVPEQVSDVPQMDMPVVDVPTMETSSGVPEQVVDVPEVGAPVAEEPVAEVPQMEMPTVELPQINVPAVDQPVDFNPVEAPVEELPQAEEGFVGPELTDELFSDEAKSLAGIIVPTEEELPESANLNDEVEASEVPNGETTEETKDEEKEKSAEEENEDAVVQELKKRYERLLQLEIDAHNNQVLLDKLRSQIKEIEDQIASDQEEISSLKKVA